MKIIKLFVIFSILIIINACFITSKNPLSKLEDAILDNKLSGLWKFQKMNETKIDGYLLILKGVDKYYEIIMFDKDFTINNSSDFYNFHAFISNINNEKYLNLQFLKIESGKYMSDSNDSFIIVNYKIKNNLLIISFLNEDFFKKAIESKIIQGSITKGSYSTSVDITDSIENLNNFIKNSKIEELIDKETKYELKKIK